MQLKLTQFCTQLANEAEKWSFKFRLIGKTLFFGVRLHSYIGLISNYFFCSPILPIDPLSTVCTLHHRRFMSQVGRTRHFARNECEAPVNAG